MGVSSSSTGSMGSSLYAKESGVLPRVPRATTHAAQCLKLITKINFQNTIIISHAILLRTGNEHGNACSRYLSRVLVRPRMPEYQKSAMRTFTEAPSRRGVQL